MISPRRYLLAGGCLALVCGLVMILANITTPGRFALIAGGIAVAMARYGKAKRAS
jgi:membrane protein implicated in regulation of membrane protease activity